MMTPKLRKIELRTKEFLLFYAEIRHFRREMPTLQKVIPKLAKIVKKDKMGSYSVDSDMF